LFVLASKMAGYLFPIRTEFFLRLRTESMKGVGIAFLHARIDPASIPVNIDHAKHAGFDDPVDNLVNAPELFRRDASFVGKGIPCHRQTNRLEASARETLDETFRNNRTAPAGLPMHNIVKGIADVDAGGHEINRRPC